VDHSLGNSLVIEPMNLLQLVKAEGGGVVILGSK
jgi:hypothetical protein